MRALIILCLIAISGCAAQDVRVPQLQQEVRTLQQEVTEMSKKLDQTNKTAVSANAKAASANVKAVKNAKKVEDVKKVAEKASDAALDAVLETKEAKTLSAPVASPMAPSEKHPSILRPREINHETSILPE